MVNDVTIFVMQIIPVIKNEIFDGHILNTETGQQNILKNARLDDPIL